MARFVDVVWGLAVLGAVACVAWGDWSAGAHAACGDGCTSSQCLSPATSGYIVLRDACNRIRRTDPGNALVEMLGGFNTKKKYVESGNTLCGQSGSVIGTAALCSSEGDWTLPDAPCSMGCVPAS
jgi:hypothetical protein